MVKKITQEVQEKFDEVFGESEEGFSEPEEKSPARERAREEEEQDELEIDEEGQEEEEQEEEKPGDDDLPSEEADDDEPGAEKESSEDELTLDAVLRQAARRSGMSDEEIDAFYDANPQLAEKTFTRLHQTQNDLSLRYARLGQRQLEEPAAPPREEQKLPKRKAKSLLEQIYGDELKNIEDDFGDDFSDRVLKPLLRPVEEMYSQYMEQKNSVVVNDIRGFFGAHKELADVYGNEKKGISQEQAKNRNELGKLADQIRAGAYAQGTEMTVPEALERANNLLVVDHLAEIERRKIVSQVKKRNKSISSRPSGRGSGRKTAPKGRSKAERAYAELAARYGIDDV